MSAVIDWEDFHRAGFRMKVAVNVPPGSIETLLSANLFREIRPKHAEWPGLVLDVNASDIAQNIALTHEVATQLSLYNVWIAIDHFHPHHALAKHLHTVPFCELKLDAKYVANCASEGANRKLCQDTIDLAHRFGKLAAAEGVENKEDGRVLMQLGCDSAQGYLFSPALQKERLIPILKSRLRKSA